MITFSGSLGGSIRTGAGVYILVQKQYLFPPPSENDIFSPFCVTFFYSHCGLFALILPYFAFILPFYFPFSHFLSPFFLFLLHFPPFSLRLFIFFPQMTSADISPPRGEVFSNIQTPAGLGGGGMEGCYVFPMRASWRFTLASG
jgi:hypothetical protein